MTNNYVGFSKTGYCYLKLVGLFLLLLLLASCSSGDSNPARPSGVGDVSYEPLSCDLIGQQRFVHRVMQDTYYWYREVPAIVDYSDFITVEELLDFLRYDPGPDRFSYITTVEQFQSFFNEGEYIGIGFSFLSLPDDRLVTRFVYPDTPATRAGMSRGDEVLSINGKTIKEINDEGAWDTIFGADEIGVPVEMEVKFITGNTITIRPEKELISIQSVLHNEVIEQNNRKIGYFVFNTFITPAIAEIDAVFAEFSSAGIDELVLDLRYNGGGQVDVARRLASYIYGNTSGSEILANFKHNNRYPDWNWELGFDASLTNSLQNLERVFVLTQPGTCSASELVINSLKPFVEVVQIGEATCGKPVGMYGHEFCDKRIQPIEFEITNHFDEGGYFEGIDPVCIAEDDPFQSFGSFDENLLGSALSFIHNGVCPVTPITSSGLMARSEHKKTSEIYTGFRREIGAF